MSSSSSSSSSASVLSADMLCRSLTLAGRSCLVAKGEQQRNATEGISFFRSRGALTSPTFICVVNLLAYSLLALFHSLSL